MLKIQEHPSGTGEGCFVRWRVRRDGGRLRTLERGEGVACLLIHGFGEGAYIWSHTMERLQAFCRPIAVDLRGHGESDWSLERRYEEREFLRDLEELLETAGFGRVVLIGHSFGASLAVELAARYQDAVIGLGIIDYSPEPAPHVTQRVRSDFRAAARAYRSVADYVAVMQQMRPMLDAEEAARIGAEALRINEDGGFVFKADPDLAGPGTGEAPLGGWPVLERVACPAVILRGQASAVLATSVARRMSARLRQAPVRSIPAAGHGVVSERPHMVADALEGFVSSVLPGRVAFAR